MAEMSVIWLRVAAALYSIGLLHSILTITQRRENLIGYALGAARIGVLLHLVSVIEEGLITGHCPIANFYETLSLCSLLIMALFLVAQWRYKVESFSVFIFPLVFVMTLVATMGRPVAAWSSPAVRSVWLTTHIVLVLLGYAALLLTAVSAVIYLIQERELKRKTPRKFYYRLPPLGTLDQLVSRFMAIGFVFLTLATIAGSTWAFIEFGTRWISDPRISISFLTWGIYLAMVVLRVTAGWRGRKAAIMAITALGCFAITWATHNGMRFNLTQ
jgi:ABC-type transport system involved in cytochrome c biogenesis permease subunit